MKRRLSLRIPGLSACVLSLCALAVGCGASASGTGLGSAFFAAAKDAHGYIESQVIPQVGRSGFPMALAASRAKVKLLQPKVTSDAERDVWLLLTMVNVMASQSHSIQEIGGPSAGAAEAARDVAVEQTECMTEATGWLSGDASKLPALKAGPCLQRVRQAAAILGK